MNKFLITSALILLVGSVFLFNSNTPAFKKFQKPAFHGLGQGLTPVMNYSHRLLIDTTQISTADDSTDKIRVLVTSNALISPTFLPASNQFEVLLTFSEYNVEQIDIVKDEELMNYEFTNTETTTVQVMFTANLDALTGEILSLSKMPGLNMEMLEIVTRDILKQAFPSIQRQGFSLSQSEGDNEDIIYGATIEEVPIDLGTVDAEIDIQETEDSITVQTSYTEENLVEFQFDLGGETPEIQFEEFKTINKELGLVSRSERVYSFSLNNNFNNLNQAENDDGIEIEVLGAMAVEISSEMTLESVSFDQTIFMNAPITTEMIDLNQNSGEFWMHPEAEQENLETPNNLSQSATFEKDYNIFEKSIFGNAFGMVLKYKNLGENSNIQANIYLNSRTLFKLVDITYNHCPGSFDKSKDFTYSLTLFKVSFPVLAIITIPVEASLRVNYGWVWKYGSAPNVNGCNITFMPYFRPGFDASGSISAVIAQAGIYATGTVANSYLSFTVDVWGLIPLTNGKIELNVSIIPFEYDVGAFYQLYTCSLKKLFSFNFKNVCSWGDRNQLSIAKNRIGSGTAFNVFTVRWGK